ncbi:hypothetical protein [Thioalkalivibrio sp. ALgr3]|uniref:hypothetical protein n=1 Tax=Thioalkalivibrio sp. ALgr3 TaxID=1239292 RepID=UPI00036F7126|nr:hypothetical protein [Thioalkalivibrio sp. ALgr3]
MKALEYLFIIAFAVNGALLIVVGAATGYPMTFSEIHSNQFFLTLKQLQVQALIALQIGLASGWMVVYRIRQDMAEQEEELEGDPDDLSGQK